MPSNDVLRQRLQDVAQFTNGHRLLIYTFVSLAALAVVITNALKNYSNFYSVAIYLSKSSRSVLALANFGILVALLCGHLVQRIFFGTLRANEVERLYDRLWFFVTESLLAFTIFRDEFDTQFAFMFGFLLFIKSFHWLASDRIEWMDQRPYPGPPLLFHFRMVVLFTIMWAIDLAMFLLTVDHTLSVGVGGMVLFASEYGILIASVMNIISKYTLSAYELRRAGQRGGENAPPWENKSMWVFYIELATDFLKLSIYLLFFTIIITFYGLPLNIVRDVYITARSFISRLKALHRYQTATRNMDQRYPNATEEELSAMSDRTCIICREEMVFHAPQAQGENRDGPNMSPKKLPCGHIFHFYCLRSWLERQQSCPTCRRTVLDAEIPPNPRANPPPAAPGAIPRAPDVNAAPALQQANNNAQDFAHRLFGGPAQAADVQNQGQHNQGVALNGQAAGQNIPILIQYELQYNPLHGQAGAIPRHNQGQQPLTPVPPFAGFQGPNDVWQAWPMNGPNNENEQVLPGGSGSAAASQPRPSTPAAERSASPVGSDSDSESGSPDGEGLTPREAARAAALRRFGGGSTSLEPTKTAPLPSTQSGTTAPSTPSRVVETSNQAGVYPQLIPIYDLNDGTQTPHRPFTQYLPRQTQTFPLSPVPPALQTPFTSGTFGSFNANRNARSSPENSRSTRLPATLTEEQLARMDYLTREAIDERLRVLERVSNTIYGCVDDLMRMRSRLPELQPSATDDSNHVGSSLLDTHRAPSGSTRRDEKRPERSSEQTEGLDGPHDDQA